MFDAKKKELRFANGRVVPCEDVRELREICHQLVEYARLLGLVREPRAGGALPVGVLRGKIGVQRKKKVTINLERGVTVI